MFALKFPVRIAPRLKKLNFSLQLNQTEKPAHIPVMAGEVIASLNLKPNKTIIDMTFGAGGHSKMILDACPTVRLFGLDRDPLAYRYGLELQKTTENFTPLRGKFSDLPALLFSLGITTGEIDGMLFDFGCSSMQFDLAERGFSISNNGPLDMRMDPENDDVTAACVLASGREEDLFKIFRIYGEERLARKIARGIIEARHKGIILKTTHDLRDLVAAVTESDHRQDKLTRHAHTATKIFQALRIFVNNELNEINYGMFLAHQYLKIGGRLVTLTFHSLEDRVVKRHVTGNTLKDSASAVPLIYKSSSVAFGADNFNRLMSSNWKPINKHVIVPSPEEVLLNPRSRSAKLRAVVRTEGVAE